MNCCDANGDCNQGRDCPARQAAKVWCHTSKQFCTQPYTCASGCQIKAYNTAYDPVYEWSLTPMGWVVLAGLAFWLAAITVYFFYF